MRLVCLLLGLLLPSSSIVYAQDQPEAVASWTVSFWAAGVNPDTGAPIISPATYLRSTSQCGQPAVPVPGLVTNPDRIRLADPDNNTLDCQLGPNTQQALFSLPLGTGYTATATANGATTSSTRSAQSNPFARAVIVVAPSVPVGVKVLR